MDWSKWFKRAGAALALALTGTGCATAPESVAEGPPPGYQPGPALWRLSDEDTTIYLFGTVHVLPENANWFDSRIERAFDESDEMVFEINLTQAADSAQMIAQRALLADGQTLRSLMTEEDRAEYEAALEGLGLPVAALDPIEPWAAALNLTLLPLYQAGYNPTQGVDMVLNTRGEGKTRDALESVDEQIGLFDSMPMDAQLEFLDATVEAVPQAVPTLDAMVSEWLAGDADGLAELMNGDMDDPELYDLLLVNRNAAWAGWIEQRLSRPGTVFIAVGAGHLAGRGSVQEQLAARGFEVERVWQ